MDEKTTEKPEDCVRIFIEAINRRDVRRIDDRMAADFTFIDASGDRVYGRDAVCDAWQDSFARFPDYRIEVTETIAGTDRIAVFGYVSGTCAGGASGKAACRQLPAAWRAVVGAGKIRVWQVYGDLRIPCDLLDDALQSPEQSSVAPELRTARLLLRPFDASDAEALFACCRNPAIGNSAGWAPHRSLEESRKVLEEVFLGREGIWAVVEPENGCLIGSIGLISDPKRQHPGVRLLGYWLDESRWGRGLMPEAARAVLDYGFTTLGLASISATCYPGNLRSKRVLERLGFLLEGTLHGAEQNEQGETLDYLSYYLPRERYGPE